MISVILLTMLIILLCGINLNWLLNLNLIYETQWTGVRSGLLISMLGKLNWFRLTDLITMVLLICEMDGSVIAEKPAGGKTLMRLIFKGLTFSTKLDWGSIAKTSSKKTGALICSMKFFSLEVALYLYKSTIRLCMKCCYHVWAVAGLLVFYLLLLLNPWLIVEM